jgi:hypothetical protein
MRKNTHDAAYRVTSCSIKKAADSGVNGRDGEVLKYRGKGGALPQWPVGAIPPVRIGAYGGCEPLSGEG